MILTCDAEYGLVDRSCTTATSRQFLRRGDHVALNLKLEDGNWVSDESKILDAVKESTDYSGNWTSEDGLVGVAKGGYKLELTKLINKNSRCVTFF
ncbi:MAG: hypothetical protein ACRC2T_10760 [Thermoguttaceae bacterium]